MLRLKLVLLSLILSSAHAQEKYWIYGTDLEDKKEILQHNYPSYCSDWIRACCYELTRSKVKELKASGLIIQPVQQFFYKATMSSPTPGFALEQINGGLMRKAGLNGEGVRIGIIDGGFGNLEADPSLKHLLENNRIITFRDYFDNEATLKRPGNKDRHGNEVLQLIAGENQEKNILFGLATHATFYLAKTDVDGFERRVEEDQLISALEWMHDQGVDIINISLGYTRGYNNKDENYRPDQMDGKTTAVAMAVEHAATEKGILIVVAAGNEANNIGWGILSTPGDAEHALTVGSSKLNVWEKTNFSSRGPEFVDYIKPDVLVFSGSGTSFSAPVITGLAACIKQFNPEYSNLDIIDIIRRSAHLYPYPNNYMGYGVPTCHNILKIFKGNENAIQRPELIQSTGRRIDIELKLSQNRIILLHKNDANHVIKRKVLEPVNSKVKIRRYKESTSTSVIYDHHAIEINWKTD